MDMPYSAYTYALYLLKNHSQTRFQLQEKLKRKQYSPEEIIETMKRLEELKLIDDKCYAENYIHDKVTFARRGRFRIAGELLQKGVDKTIIDKATQSITEEQELEAAKSLLSGRQRTWSNLDERKKYIRAVSLLQRHGFSGKIIKTVLNTPEDED